MFNKVTLRSYSYLLHFLHLNFGEKWLLQLCPIVPCIVQKPQGILVKATWPQVQESTS
jgi:hypothetical protein